MKRTVSRIQGEIAELKALLAKAEAELTEIQEPRPKLPPEPARAKRKRRKPDTNSGADPRTLPYDCPVPERVLPPGVKLTAAQGQKIRTLECAGRCRLHWYMSNPALTFAEGARQGLPDIGFDGVSRFLNSLAPE